MGIDVVSKTSFRHMFYSSSRLPMRTGGMIIETAKFQIVLVCVMQNLPRAQVGAAAGVVGKSKVSCWGKTARRRVSGCTSSARDPRLHGGRRKHLTLPHS